MARAFNIDQKCVQTWIKQKEQIVTMVREARGTNKKRKCLNGGERKAVDPCMEEDLLDGYAI